MPNPGNTELGRLRLQFERHLLTQARLRLLLAQIDGAVADDRQALRQFEARRLRGRRAKVE
jgi:hypothetical protein